MAEARNENAFYPAVVHHYPSDFRHGRNGIPADLADAVVGGDVMNNRPRPHDLTDEECGFICGILEDIQADEEYETAWMADQKATICTILIKLGGTIFDGRLANE